MTNALIKQQAETEKLGTSVRKGVHTKFRSITSMLITAVVVLIPIGVLTNYGWKALFTMSYNTTEQANQSNSQTKTRTPAQLAAEQAETELAIKKATARTDAQDVRTDCGGRYTDLRNCRNVYFGINEKYRVESPVGICPRADPGSAGTWKEVAQNQYDFIPYHDGARVTFFELQVGESFSGNTCK